MSITTDTVLALIEDCAKDLSLLPILADALEDCGEQELASRCRCPLGRTTADNAPDILSAWAFFIRNAGYCTPPGVFACAWKLAVAERHAQEEGWEYEWGEDVGEWGYSQSMVATLWGEDDEGTMVVLASLGGIDLPFSDDYERVVQAELALEAINNSKE